MEEQGIGIEQELKALEEREVAILERVKQMNILHEDIIVINRHDMDTVSWLEMDERNREGRRRSSWYGTIIKVSEINCGDDVRESKKKGLKPGDVVIFNPESAYSLNVAKYPEIWILHVDSILMKDFAYDYMAQKKENLHKKHEIIENARRSMGGPREVVPVRTTIIKK